MTVKKEITRLEKSSAKLSVTIGKDDVNSEYQELLKTYTKSIQLPGFRKGKVPQEVLIRKYGDALKDEAMGKIIEKSLEELFEGEALAKEDRPLPYSRPELEGEPKLDLDKDLEFSVIYDVLPIVKIESWEGFTAEIPEVSIEEEDISRELEQIRERNSIVLDKNEGETAVSGDVVTIDHCELDESGVMLENSERKDFTFSLGGGQNAYDFDNDIIGMKKGETKEFSKTYADDHPVFPGMTKKLKLTLTALKIKNLPDLDDDLAQDVDEKFKTLDDLKNSIKTRLNKDLEQRLRALKINKILDQLMEKTPLEIPESMLRMELDARWRNLARRFNTDAGGLYKMMGERSEAILEEWKGDAAKSLHSRLIVETIMEGLGLKAPPEEVEKEIERIAQESNTSLENVQKYYEDERAKEFLAEEIKERKFYDILLEKNTLKTGKKVKYIDLNANIE